jgi:hypothetical protein
MLINLAQLLSNPDISGTGVRLAFYIQAFLTGSVLISNSNSPCCADNRCSLGVLAYTPKADVDASYWSMTITAFALFISATALHNMRQLSLYQGILVADLLYLHSYIAVISLLPHYRKSNLAYVINAPTRQQRSHDWWSGMLRTLPVLSIATVFGLFIWTHAPTFGSQPECNHQTTFVFLAFPFPALGSGRTAALAMVWAHAYMISILLIGGALLSLSNLLMPPETPDGRPAIRITWTPLRTFWETLVKQSAANRSIGGGGGPQAHLRLQKWHRQTSNLFE